MPGDPSGSESGLCLGPEEGSKALIVGIEAKRGLQDVTEVEDELAVLALHHVGRDEGADVGRFERLG
jgi:hypothetical protein